MTDDPYRFGFGDPREWAQWEMDRLDERYDVEREEQGPDYDEDYDR